MRRWSISDGWWERASHGGAHEGHAWERRGPFCSHIHLQSRNGSSLKYLGMTDRSTNTNTSWTPKKQMSGTCPWAEPGPKTTLLPLVPTGSLGRQDGTAAKSFAVIMLPLVCASGRGKNHTMLHTAIYFQGIPSRQHPSPHHNRSYFHTKNGEKKENKNPFSTRVISATIHSTFHFLSSNSQISKSPRPIIWV